MAGLRAITTASVDLIATNPPYGMGIADWDHIPDYLAWAKPWLTECVRVLKPASSLYMFGRLESLAELIDLLERLGLQFQDFLIWETIQGASGPPLWVKRNEVILFAMKGEDYYIDPEAVKLERHEEHIREYKGVE